MAPAPVLRRCKGGPGRTSRDCYVSLPEGCSHDTSSFQDGGSACLPGDPLDAAFVLAPSPLCPEGGRHKISGAQGRHEVSGDEGRHKMSGAEESSSLAPPFSLSLEAPAETACEDSAPSVPLQCTRSDSVTASSAAGADASQAVQLTSSASEGVAAPSYANALSPASPSRTGNEGGSASKGERGEESSTPSRLTCHVNLILTQGEDDVAGQAVNPSKSNKRRPTFGSSSTFSGSRGLSSQWDWSDEDTGPGNSPLEEPKPQTPPEHTGAGPSSGDSGEWPRHIGGRPGHMGGLPLKKTSDISCCLKFLGLTGLTEEELVEALHGRQAAAAAESLRMLAKRGPIPAQRVVDAGALPPLTQLLTADDISAVEHASAALLHLGRCEQTRGSVLWEPGLVKGMVHVLSSHWPTAQANAVAILRSLAAWAPGSVRREMVMSGALSLLVKLLEEGEEAVKKDCAACLLALSRCKGCRAAAVKAGVVPVLCTVLKEGTCIIDEEAAGIFLALSRDEGGAASMLQGAAIPALAGLLRSGATEGSREHALGALLAVAGREGEFSEAVAWAVAEVGVVSGAGAGSNKILLLEDHAVIGTASLQQKASALWRLLQRSSSELKTGSRTSVQQETLEASV